jgi:AcrR family transcriptional regulator
MRDRTFLTPKSARTFDTVVRAASDLFGRQGYHRTTIRDIARESGLGLGGVYYYVRSKEELVLLFYERVTHQIDTAFRKQPPAKIDLPELLSRFLRLKIAHLTPYRELLTVVMKEAIDPASPLCPLNAASAPVLASSVALFREMIVASGAAKGAEVDQMARGLWMAHMGVLMYWLHDRSEGQSATERAIDTLGALVLWSGRASRIPGFGALRNQSYSLIEGLFQRSGTGDVK